MFDNIPSQYLLIGSTIMAIFMGSFAMFIRLRAQKKPVTAKKIMIPPFAMSTGALMFIFEEFRVGPLQILEAVGIGLLFSVVLIATSKFEIRDDAIYMKQSKAFPFILIGLLILRIILKLVFSDSFNIGELGGMFFLLAFAMILPWRIGMLIKFKKLQKTYSGA
ncbi:MAG: cytochrome c biogenesis protein CcdC [Solibacillus sp.]|uniref:CcdC family protein n=1 Tax=unclassified Solibacillus TaxID=2637870 RepID=UPI0030F629F6